MLDDLLSVIPPLERRIEARAAARLRHPNIVSIHEVGEVYGQHYIAMDYIEGESLASWIKREPPMQDQAASLLSTISHAVHHLHADGVSSPLIAGYPLLIVGASLWFRTALVWFMTGLSAASYSILLLDALYRRTDLSIQFARPAIILASMVILGYMVTYQVSRLQAMKRYYRSKLQH